MAVADIPLGMLYAFILLLGVAYESVKSSLRFPASSRSEDLARFPFSHQLQNSYRRPSEHPHGLLLTCSSSSCCPTSFFCWIQMPSKQALWPSQLQGWAHWWQRKPAQPPQCAAWRGSQSKALPKTASLMPVFVITLKKKKKINQGNMNQVHWWERTPVVFWIRCLKVLKSCFKLTWILIPLHYEIMNRCLTAIKSNNSNGNYRVYECQKNTFLICHS